MLRGYEHRGPEGSVADNETPDDDDGALDTMR